MDKERTKEIAEEIKDGTYVDRRTDTRESWFPNRGIIKKDQEAISKLYGHTVRNNNLKETKDDTDSKKDSSDTSNVYSIAYFRKNKSRSRD